MGLFALSYCLYCITFQSTHPVRGGTYRASKHFITGSFQSTHPVRGGTIWAGRERTLKSISIHPPREGWDNWNGSRWAKVANFNPPPPGGGGRRFAQQILPTLPFQSTHPVRGGTVVGGGGANGHGVISIHPPREGWDNALYGVFDGSMDFNPPTP